MQKYLIKSEMMYIIHNFKYWTWNQRSNKELIQLSKYYVNVMHPWPQLFYGCYIHSAFTCISKCEIVILWQRKWGKKTLSWWIIYVDIRLAWTWLLTEYYLLLSSKKCHEISSWKKKMKIYIFDSEIYELISYSIWDGNTSMHKDQ